MSPFTMTNVIGMASRKMDVYKNGERKKHPGPKEIIVLALTLTHHFLS